MSYFFINNKGEVIFRGDDLNRDMIASDGALIFDKIPAFRNGVCYIPTYNRAYKYDVFASSGKFLRNDNYPPETPKKDNGYRVFVDEYTKLRGVKDRNGNIVVPAKYFNISTDQNGNAAFSNGVFNVQLLEIAPSRPDGAVVYYGYADLYGHDSFAQYVIDRVNKSNSQYGARPAVDEEKVDESNEE